MAISTLEGVESVRVTRASGHLKIAGCDRSAVEIDSDVEPRVSVSAGVAEVKLRGHATITVPAGVAVEVEDVGGHLEVSDLTTPFVVNRVRGNMDLRRVGAVSIRDTLSGNLNVKQAGSIDGEKVRGALNVESASAITFSLVAGGLDCRSVDGEVAIEKVAGSAHLSGLREPFIARVIGGHLEVEDGAHVEAGVVGGKFAAEGVAGEIAIGFVGGRVRVSRLGGALSLEDVGGAVDLAGPFPLDKTWMVRSRGRINVEVDASASLELDASAGWGRVRVYGIEAPGLKWADKNHVHGPIGPDPASGSRTKVAVETSGADVIVASAEARERDFSGRGYRSRASAAFAAPFEDLVDDLGGEIPQFVRSVLDAAGQFVAESGGLSSGIVREVTRDVKRSVSEGLREVERAIDEVQQRVPDDVGEKLSKLGKDIGDLLAETVRGGSREARTEMRERVRQAAREMRDKIRDAARDMRTRSHSEPAATLQSESEKPTPDSAAGKFAPGATQKLSREDAILEILAAVKDGKLEPDEADDLINAWMEVERGNEVRH